ncbi:MAG: hypothetical protein E5W56_08685, partial [Mesorhizobium sp.]
MLCQRLAFRTAASYRSDRKGGEPGLGPGVVYLPRTWRASMTKWVYTFGDGAAEGRAGDRNLLGGKGAN